MGNEERRAESFMRSLTNAGFTVVRKPTKAAVPWATTGALPAAVAEQLLVIFRGMGGIPAHEDSLAPRHWDMRADDLLIEFDEALHFNRYRSLSLAAPWSAVLPWSEAYTRYSLEMEGMCLSDGAYGKKWANPSCKSMFGESDEPGVLGSLGSSRWKQRAVYDALKDAYALHTQGVALARVSIHDEVGGMNVNQATKKDILLNPVALQGFIRSRTVSAASRS